MGVIYSGIELEQGAIPRDGAHVEAADMVLAKLSDIEWVTTALVHGSVIDGKSNRRSDLDVLAVYDFDNLSQIPKSIGIVKKELDEVGKRTAVKIEANIWPLREPLGARKQRMYDMLFSWHLRHAMIDGKGLVGEADKLTLEVADMLPAGDVEAIRDVALNYTVYKQGGFTGAPSRYIDGDPRALSAMQRGLELPKAVGRKVAQLVAACEGREVAGNDFNYDNDLLDGTTRIALARLGLLNADYTEYLEEMYAKDSPRQVEVKSYVRWLDSTYNIVMSNGILATVGLSQFIHDYQVKI